jgi:hypothetical protein
MLKGPHPSPLPHRQELLARVQPAAIFERYTAGRLPPGGSELLLTVPKRFTENGGKP